MNRQLFHGPNQKVLAGLDEGFVDVAYIDPPFCTGKNFGAFDDRWGWSDAYAKMLAELPWRAQAVLELADYLAEPDPVRAYLVEIGTQLSTVRRVVRGSGSVWVHVDHRLVHWVRHLCDVLLKPAKLQNEVIWRYRRWTTRARRLQKMHDVILWYAGNGATFHTLYGIEKLADSTLKTFGGKKQRADFSGGTRRPGKEIAVSPGPALSDVWEIKVLPPSGHERSRGNDYPTQKPEALIERVLRVSSNEGDMILDPCCGSGTTLAVAERLGRRWVGIDASEAAINTSEKRLGVTRTVVM